LGLGTDFIHALRSTELFKLKGLVLHGQLVAALALAVKPFQKLWSQAKRSTH
jgi:hypothetical protein